MRTALACFAFLVAIAFYGVPLSWALKAILLLKLPELDWETAKAGIAMVCGTVFVCIGATTLERDGHPPA